MGVDLDFYFDEYTNFTPTDDPKCKDWFLVTSKLTLHRHRALWDEIHELGERELGLVLDCYWDEGIEKVTENAYGGKLTYLTALELREIPLNDTSDWNKAIFKFIRALPPETKVVLYWH